MKRPPVTLRLVIALVFSGLSVATHAQTILRGKDITEENLIEALTPSAGKARTRSIRVEREETSATEPSAALLITFRTNSAQLTPSAQSSLDVVGHALKADRLSDFEFLIEGHADPRGRPDANLRLSEARARSVVDYLTAHHRINPERLKSVGKGDTEPAIPSRPAAPENRRVTITTVSD